MDFNTSIDMNNDGFHIPRRDGGSFSLTPVSIRTGARLSAEHLFVTLENYCSEVSTVFPRFLCRQLTPVFERLGTFCKLLNAIG